MENLLVTVYVVTYKKFDTIFRNIASILNQTYANIELIVSDDGSENFPKDSIVDYITTNRKSNITSYQVIANPSNVGTVKHINKVLSLAHGELFVPLAGDDEFYNNDVISLIVDEYRKKPFNVLSTSRIAIDEEGCEAYFIPHILDRIIIKVWIRTAKQQLNRLIQNRFHNFASGSVMTIRAEFFREMGGHDERYILWEDGPFIIKTTSSGKKISTCYDIVSVKYKLGGISTGGAKGVIKKYLDYDMGVFQNDLGKYKLSHLTHRKTKWEGKAPKIASGRPLLWFKVKYVDLFVMRKLEKILEGVFCKYDKWVLKKRKKVGENYVDE